MTDETKTYEPPQVVESIDELDVFGETPAHPTLVAGSGTPVNAV